MKAFVGLVLLVALVGMERPPANVGLRLIHVAADSVTLEISWTAPPREPGQTPILGYDWQLFTDSVRTANGSTPPTVRRVEVSVGVNCTMAETYSYQARVRATGNFSGPAPWGISPAVLYSCDNSPPGAPVVGLDTLEAPPPGEPDSLKFDAVYVPPSAIWDREAKALGFTDLNDPVTLCAFEWRDGQPFLAPRADNVVSAGDTAQLVLDDGFVRVQDAPPHDRACWYVEAVAVGGSELHLCQTCPSILARAGLLVFPERYGMPLLLLGLAFHAAGFWAWRRRGTRRARGR